jgi:Cd2+/Zn2+-exporting ATPase
MSESCCAPGTEHEARSTGTKHEAPSTKHSAHSVSANAQVLLAASAIAMLLAWMLDWYDLHVAAVAIFTLVILACVREPAARAWRSVRGGVLDINVLMVIAVAGAIALGDWIEAASVVWLFALSQQLESLSLTRARRAIRSMMAVAPSQALVRRGGRESQMLADDVRPGDVVIVRPGERVPVDGLVVAGTSAVDQAPVTGESWPVEKVAGDQIFAGTINGTGAIEVEALRPASDSAIARIIRLVEHAQAERAPVQTFVDRFARRYTPAVALLGLAVAVIPPLVMGGGLAAFGVWGYRAITLLVVACPCALVISTPVSIVSAITTAARHGVLIKGGGHLERAASIRCVAFDKTGTLTHGRVTVTDILGVEGVSSEGVLSIAASLESRSEHPIGRAIVNRALQDGIEAQPGHGFRALPGLGAEALVGAMPAVVGSHRLFEERQLCTPALHARFEQLTSRGETAVLVGHDGAGLGVIGLGDELRESGRVAVARLRSEGIGHIALLTGDLRVNADVVAAAFGLDEVHAELMPERKVELVHELRRRHGPVAMIGDGINDAPALAAADLGIAMGAAGSGVAMETADVALMSDELDKMPYVLRLGRATMRNIHTNVAIALGLKVGFIALAMAGVATLWMAVVADTGASLLVTANAIRLLRVRP